MQVKKNVLLGIRNVKKSYSYLFAEMLAFEVKNSQDFISIK